jgi:hypothetical protein
MKLNLVIIIFASPIIFLMEVIVFNQIVEMLRQPSDIAVTLGLLLTCVGIIGNYYLIKYINKQFKQLSK